MKLFLIRMLNPKRMLKMYLMKLFQKQQLTLLTKLLMDLLLKLLLMLKRLKL